MAKIDVHKIKRNEIAFITGVEPSLTRKYKLIGSVDSDPKRKSVVLKFSNDIKKATAAPPIIAGLKYFSVICHIT